MRYIATFGSGQTFAGYYCEIEAPNEVAARMFMADTFGKRWCTTYSKEEWEKPKEDPMLELFKEKRLETNKGNLFVVELDEYEPDRIYVEVVSE